MLTQQRRGWRSACDGQRKGKRLKSRSRTLHAQRAPNCRQVAVVQHGRLLVRTASVERSYTKPEVSAVRMILERRGVTKARTGAHRTHRIHDDRPKGSTLGEEITTKSNSCRRKRGGTSCGSHRNEHDQRMPPSRAAFEVRPDFGHVGPPVSARADRGKSPAGNSDSANQLMLPFSRVHARGKTTMRAFSGMPTSARARRRRQRVVVRVEGIGNRRVVYRIEFVRTQPRSNPAAAEEFNREYRVGGCASPRVSDEEFTDGACIVYDPRRNCR